MLGWFHTAKEGAIAYDAAKLQLKGPDTWTNFRKEDYVALPVEAPVGPPVGRGRVRNDALPAHPPAPNPISLVPAKSSRFRGVSWSRPTRRWIAQVGHRSKNYQCGSYADEEAAARAYDRMAIKVRATAATAAVVCCCCYRC